MMPVDERCVTTMLEGVGVAISTLPAATTPPDGSVWANASGANLPNTAKARSARQLTSILRKRQSTLLGFHRWVQFIY
jgi:hypothetical protein